MAKLLNRARAPQKMWTKEEVRKVLELWENTTTSQLAEELGRSPLQVSYIASEIRKSGYNLPRKKKKAYVQLLIKEVTASLRRR